jgi:signal transduction histidine kinase
MQWPHSMLPGTTRRSARDWIVDVAMFFIAVGLSMFVMDDTWDQHGNAGELVDMLLGAFALIAIWFRRRHPVSLGAAVLIASAFSAGAAGPSLFMIFNAAIRAPRRALVWLTVLALACTAVFPLIYPGSETYVWQLAFGALIIGVAVGWGLFVRARRELERQLRDRAERLEAEQRLRVEQARDAERRRIAGEMHDVLAHRVTLLAVHAGALEFRPDAPPEDVAHAAGVIRRSAQTALHELREVIGVLRDDRADGEPEPPQPTLDSIPALIEESRAAGMHVRSTIDVAGGEALVGRTAYRVVQEGLTNARKHAPASAVDVSVTAPGGSLVVEVRSRPSAAARAALPGAGTGLIGLAERVSLAGGELQHGRDERGDFRLRATLPLNGPGDHGSLAAGSGPFGASRASLTARASTPSAQDER